MVYDARPDILFRATVAAATGDNAGASAGDENPNGGGNTQTTPENGQNGQGNGSDDGQQGKDEVIIPQGTMRRKEDGQNNRRIVFVGSIRTCAVRAVISDKKGGF